ncbi:hypothetical protein SBRCBS47491_004690 [Sporothrix bragantina]|uniref:Major facilitator superfamily (MFS) profile domain-containing protein n=1 Tax=Sporothrix bragantina TaxID=671064 RepID=A0ABP0BRU3_9PEZI
MKYLTNPFSVPEATGLPKEIFGWRPYLITFSASWAAACYGYDGGFIGGTLALPSFQHAFGLDTAASAAALAGLKSNIVTTFQAGAFFGAIFGYLGGAVFGIGRRPALMCSMSLMVIGSILELFPHVAMLYVGRALTGLAVGSAMLVLPIYIAEFAPNAIRGRLVAIFEVMVQIFLVIGFWVNYGVVRNLPGKNSSAQWRIPFALQFIPSVLCMISIPFMIESPRWLLTKGRNEDARRALAWVRHLPGDHELIQTELNEMQASISIELELTGESRVGGIVREHRRLFRELCAPGVRNRVLLSICLMMLQQLTGINAVNYFSPIIFQELGYSTTEVALLATGVYGIVKMVSSILFSFFIVDRFGRRPPMLIGAAVMAVCMFYVGAFAKIVGNDPATAQVGGGSPGGQAALAMIYIYIIANSASWTSIPWIFAAEVFPTRIRSFAMMFPTATQYLGQFVVVYSLPYMVNSIKYGTYLFYAAWIVVGFVFTYFLVPETKGVSLEDMDLLFDAGASVWARAARKRYETAHAAGVTAVAVHAIETEGKEVHEERVETV